MCRKLFLLVCFVLVLGFAGKASAVIYSEDIGDVALAGSSSYDEVNDIWTVVGDGADIWGGSDQFHYVYRPVSGDCVLEADLTSLDETDFWAKGGVMIREALDAGSKHAFMAATPHCVSLQWRYDTGGGSADSTNWDFAVPRKLRITRDVDMFIGEYYLEVIPLVWMWIEQARVVVPMNDDVLIGLVVCSHTDANLCTGVFEDALWTATPCYRAWNPSPADGATGLPQDLTLSWRPGDDATLHDVYLGTNPAALVSVATGLEEPNHALASLEGDVTYYWRVDEHGASITTGTVWSFKTAKVLRPGTGTILGELWFDIGGTVVSDLTGHPDYPDNPSYSTEITSFDAGADLGDNYGGRIQGWLVPETTGYCRFWIASDDASELWLSTTEKSGSAVLIASVAGWSGQYAYDMWGTQGSESIWLEGGERYFIRALWKEGGGGDNCSVAWEGPDSEESPARTVIDGYYLGAGYVDLWAYNPSPAHRATRVALDATLSWSAGEDANSHEVYFGTDPGALPQVATKELGDESYDPGPLELETTYYWQIVEVNGPDFQEGDIWSFKTPRVRPFTGTIARDVFEGIGGDNIWDLINNPAYPENPTWSDEITALVSPDLGKDNFGAMMEGYLLPETDGEYKFWIAADDGSELWLSTDDDPANAVRIAYWDVYSGNYDAHAEQCSALIPLLAETRYYIRAAYKEGGGGDWCSVAWRGLDTGGSRQDIDGYYLMPRDWASDPSPKNGSTVATREPEVNGLSWSVVGPYADSYNIYLGTSPVLTIADLIDAKPVGDETCVTGPLVVDTTYYWRVDQVGPGGTIPGHVWSFTTAEWVNVEVGGSWGGSAVQDVNGVWTIIGDGGDIWDGGDSFHFVYQMPRLLPSGDCTVIARVESITGGNNSWRKAGMMVRETLEGGSRNACILMTPPEGENRVTFQSRPETNGGSGSYHYNGVITPEWVKLVRNGDMFTGFHAEDVNGTPGEWRQLGGPRTVVMPKDVYVGMAVTSHNWGQLTTAVMDNVSMTPRDPQQSWGPSPQNGEEGVPIDPLLSWGEGEGIVFYAVYFSDNYDDVVSGAALVDVGTEPNYDPGYLDLTQTYYWAVDGIVTDGRIWSVTLGEIWSFTISDHRLIEDFEAYDIIPVAPPNQVAVEDGYPAVPVAPSDANLVVYYSFDNDDANDSSGNERHAREERGPSYVNGKVGRALQLDGNGDHVIYDADGGACLNGLSGMTISLWIKSDKDWTNKGFFHGENPGGKDRRGFRYDNKGGSSKELKALIKYGVFSNGGSEEDESSGEVQTKSWQHLVMTWSSEVGLTLYINGVKDTPAWDSSFKNGPRGGVTEGYDRLIIGKGGKDNKADKSWDGLIDEVKIYNYAVSYGEARSLAGETTTLDVPTVYGPMIAEYLFDTDASDTSLNELHGTLKGNAHVDGSVLHLDGNGDYVDLGHHARFNLGDGGDGSFSISAWFNMSGWGDNWKNVIISERGEGGRGWQLRRRGSAKRLTFTTRGPGDDDPQGNITPSLNEWHHVVCVLDRDSQTKTVYLDGEVDRQVGGVHSIEWSGHTTYIGARATKDNRNRDAWFHGMIDDVRLYYNHALTPLERLYLSGFQPTVFLSDTWTDSGEVSSIIEWEAPHWGNRAMRVDCNGDGEVSRDAPFENWTSGNAKAMVLYFKGDAGNAPEDMYVKLTSNRPSGHSSTLSYDGDINDLKIPVWQRWIFSLEELAAGEEGGPGEGVPLPHIGEVAIGLTGTGTVYFDDLRLETTQCVPKFGPLADFTNDCKVDLKDLRVITEDWLYGPNDNGLWYEYYEGYWGGSLPYFDVLTLARQGPVNNFDIGVRRRNDGFAFRFTGLIDLPADANYTFYTSSDDGSKLYIGDTQVVDNDGFHGMQWREGTINLTAGKHPITVTMFEDGGGEGLQVEYASDAAIDPITRQSIPDDVLYRLPYPPSDLSEDDAVNFDDYAILAEQWLDEILFP